MSLPFASFYLETYVSLVHSGGGIGGITLAIALSHSAPHVEVDIYESASAFGMVGAGIGMWPRVWDALKAIGLKDELDRYAASATGGMLIETQCTACGLSR